MEARARRGIGRLHPGCDRQADRRRGGTNDFLTGLFAGIGIRLVDFKLEFGRLWEDDYRRVILADEISPDGCRLWDMKTNEKMDKDRFRRDLGGEVEAYQEVARRLGLLPEGSDGSVLDLDEARKARNTQ